MKEQIRDLPRLAKDKYKENKRFFSKLKKRPPRGLDQMMLELHEAEFQNTDCLACANCCKTTGPLFTSRDIGRIARHFKLKPGDFIDSYLRRDEDDDYVLQELPCRFLDADNHCMIYDIRPKACREFPHTDRKKFHKISHLTVKNVAVCPAAFNIVERMKENIK
ncbi:MAG: YkgJ family cysteine cluster protein [Flavobacteriaceae bacterium]|nr:YkgJ family cysteine cluster protein [Flavobacteriaceae bacterium]